MSNDFVNPQTSYKVLQQSVKPSYRFSKLTPQTGGTTANMSASSTEVIFELPNRCMNLSESSLKFRATVAAQTGVLPWMYSDLLAPFYRVSLTTRNNVDICDLSNVAQYTKMALKTSKREDLSINGDIINFAGISDNATYEDNYRNDHNGVTGPSYASTPYEQQYFNIGSTANTAIFWDVEIPLKFIKDTIFSLDKDLYFNEVLLLKIHFNPLNKWGAMAGAVNDVEDAPATINAIALTKLYLYLALEENPYICAGLQEKVMTEGLVVNIPYVHMVKTNIVSTTAGQVQTCTIRLNGTQGNYLKRIYHGLFPADESTAFGVYSLDNIDETNYVYYHTTLDNARRQEYNVLTGDGDDWTQIKKYLKGGPIDQAESYRYNWFIVDDFGYIEGDEGEAVDSGFPLMGSEHTWQANVSAAGNTYNHYTFAVMTKKLMITSQQIEVR